MEENDQNNDEYKFGELDSIDEEPMGEPSTGNDTPKEKPTEALAALLQNQVLRNGLIAVGVIVVGLLGLRFIGPLFVSKPEQMKPAIAPMAQPAPQTQPQPQFVENQVASAPVTPPPPADLDPAMKQKVADIEANQMSIKSEVSSVSEQVGTVNTNVTNLGEQMAKLNQVIAELTNQVAKQSLEINMLMAKSRPKITRRTVGHLRREAISYNLQAVIPGRAWIIGSNGSTLTVRVGTKVQGYGVVKLIDSIQGRVLTSSGRTIRFSQSDS
jgi:intracellular multiplication protein IcmG